MSNNLKHGSRNHCSENWKVYHPDGITHMYTTNSKKAKWYLSHNYAKQRAPFEIILTFNPNGKGFHENEIFGRSPREFRCVVCGIGENLQRHHIVPYHYRKFMTEEYKSRNHHDVVIICSDHHQEYERHSDTYKDYWASYFRVSSISDINRRNSGRLHQFFNSKIKANKLIGTLLYKINEIPEERANWMILEIGKCLNIPKKEIVTYTLDQLNNIYENLNARISEHKYNIDNESNKYHGQLVIQKLDSHNKLRKFIKAWRKHFLKKMNPQYMPEGWTVRFRTKSKIYNNDDK